MAGHPPSKMTYRKKSVHIKSFVSHHVSCHVIWTHRFCICLILMAALHCAHIMIIDWSEWVAFSAWLSTFWQQPHPISETGWLSSLPQFCSNEGAVLPKQTGSLEMYLNYLPNPGSLSYLLTNGPAARRSALRCHPSVQPQSGEQVQSFDVRKVKEKHWALWHKLIWIYAD